MCIRISLKLKKFWLSRFFWIIIFLGVESVLKKLISLVILMKPVCRSILEKAWWRENSSQRTKISKSQMPMPDFFAVCIYNDWTWRFYRVCKHVGNVGQMEWMREQSSHSRGGYWLLYCGDGHVEQPMQHEANITRLSGTNTRKTSYQSCPYKAQIATGSNWVFHHLRLFSQSVDGLLLLQWGFLHTEGGV